MPATRSERRRTKSVLTPLLLSPEIPRIRQSNNSRQRFAGRKSVRHKRCVNLMLLYFQVLLLEDSIRATVLCVAETRAPAPATTTDVGPSFSRPPRTPTQARHKQDLSHCEKCKRFLGGKHATTAPRPRSTGFHGITGGPIIKRPEGSFKTLFEQSPR